MIVKHQGNHYSWSSNLYSQSTNRTLRKFVLSALHNEYDILTAINRQVRVTAERDHWRCVMTWVPLHTSMCGVYLPCNFQEQPRQLLA